MIGIRRYNIWLNCDNCKVKTLCGIPKGITIKERVKSGKAACSYCGCVIKTDEGFEVDKV